MSLQLSAEEIELVTASYVEYQQGGFNADSMMGLTVRVRVAVFVCIAQVHLNADGVWAGPFAQLARTVLPDAYDGFINNLGTDLKNQHLRVTASFEGMRYEVFFLTQQLADLMQVDLPGADDEEGPEYFMQVLERLDGDDKWSSTIAGLIVQYGCEGASGLLRQMQHTLDPQSVHH